MTVTEKILERHNDIANNCSELLPLPKFDRYCICNLRGGVGKTSLAFNLSFLADDVLAVDTCPQGNLSYFFNPLYYTSGISSYDMLLPYFLPGFGFATHVAQSVGATNRHFQNRKCFYIPSSDSLYNFASHMTFAFSQTASVSGLRRNQMIDGMLYSLRNEIERELSETGVTKCIIDTSPFFAGATHLAWHAMDALIVPVRTDRQSINSLNLLLQTLSSPTSPFRMIMPSDKHTPKIQLIVLTHCGWSTRAGARHQPNQQTRMYLEQVIDLTARNITHFTTDSPENHIVLLDDFLGSGRISTAQSKPLNLLIPGESATVQRVRVEVNDSVEKIKRQLRFINEIIW